MKETFAEQLFTSSQVLKAVNISYRQLSYWELKGIIKPVLQKQGTRDFKRYTQKDMDTLKNVKNLLDEGYSLPTADTLNEIAKRKAAEEKLKKYQLMVESAYDAIFFKDLKSRYVIVNNKTLEAFGLPSEQVVGKNDYAIMPNKEEAKAQIENDQIVFKTEKPREFAKHMTGINGKERWFEAIKVPQFDDKGNIIGLVGIARDITEQKKAQEELQKSKEFAEELITCMKDGVSILDRQGFHINVNTTLCQMTGFTREELIGSGPPHLYWPEEEYENIEKTFQKTLRGEFDDFKLIFMRKNGERFPVIVSPSWIKDKQGNVVSYFATIKDITKHKQLVEAGESV